MAKLPLRSAAALHKQWATLEDERHQLAIAIHQAKVAGVDSEPARRRQAKLLLEIDSLVVAIRNAPATTIEDFIALIDVALEHELDLAADIAWYGPSDYPIIGRLLRMLARKAPGFEFNSLRRWLSSPGQLEELMGNDPSPELSANDDRADRL